MKKIVTLFATVLLLYGCGSVPLTGRKQMLLVSDSEVLSSLQETDAACIRTDIK